MGACYSAPGAELPAATDEEIKELKERGCLPCVATPSVDFEGKNQLQTVYVARYEHGVELTLLFLDEDRPNACGDCFYDTIRRPLFGRYSDIETIFIIYDQDEKVDKVEFPGTYSGDQTWKAAAPQHGKATIALEKFEKREGGELVLWINTWNHLIGDKNNNSTMAITYQNAQPEGGQETVENKDFVIRKGSRSDVDARFNGLMTSVSEVMTEERQKRLGKRLM